MRSLVLALAVVAVAGCARNPYDRAVPWGCEAPYTAYLRALDRAPAEVRINGVHISDCFVDDASTGDVQRIGTTLVQTASELAARDDGEPLGYLVGAVQRGTERTQGVYGELVRRLEQEAAAVARTRPYRRGLRAGRTSG